MSVLLPPYRRITIDEVDSTNRLAFERAAAGEKGPLWIVARRQTAGRGRSGRPWSSEPGNLYASLLVEMACPPTVVPQVSLVAGVAVASAIKQVLGDRSAALRLKWPNDVLIGQAKCVGILAESTMGRESVTVVIGIGINLAWHPTDLGRMATSLAEQGAHISPDAMFDGLAPAMQHWLEVWQCGVGFGSVRDAWLAQAGQVGENCSVNTGTERLEGKFLGIDAAGALLMQDNQGRQRSIGFGDVTLMPAPGEERGK